MSAQAAAAASGPGAWRARLPSLADARAYLAPDATRAVQVLLGLFWVIDGGLQFQPFMYSQAWVGQLASMQAGQPQWLASGIAWGIGLAGSNLAVWNTLFALIQVAIGLGLLYRRTVKVALVGSLAWAAIVWWLGEAFGMLFMSTASPLTGAPGAVVLYALTALVTWPNGRPGGLLGERGSRVTWAVLWVVMGWLWLLPANSGGNSVSNAIASVPAGIGWLTSALAHVAQAAQGRGLVIALTCAGLSALIGFAVGFRWHARVFLWAAIVLSLLYWVVGQGLGGIATGDATDVDTAPVFVLLACALFTLFPKPVRSAAGAAAPAAGQPRDAADGRRPRPQPTRRVPESGLGRRAVVAAGVAAGAGLIAGCSGLFGGKGNSDGQSPAGLRHPVPGGGNNGHHDEQHGNGPGNDNGGQSGSSGSQGDPNAGIVTLSSQLPLPAQFRSPLPVPVQLKPARQTSDTDYYEIVQSQATAEIIPGVRTQIWGYNGTFPGPTIMQNPGRRVVVTHRNALPVPTVVHLHGGTTPHDSDGYPTDLVLPAASYGTFPVMPAMAGMPAMADPDAVITRLTRDYTYPPQPRAATLWYHDHRMDFTGASVYRGLAGFHIAQDDAEQALPLPKGPRDVPLMIADRAFAADGSFLYPSLDPALRSVPGVGKSSMNGVMGDVILVNGAPWPVMKVDTARYRLRILNASNARTYQLALDDPSQGTGFTQIGTDHGLLAEPLPQDSIMISPAQRFDVIIDFSRHKPGDQVTVVNQLGAGSTAVVMRFVVSRAVTDNSSIPATLSQAGLITPTPAMTQRTMKFHRGGGDWTINGQLFDPGTSQADVPAGSTELWTIQSDFHHPVHIHNATILVVARDDQAPGPYDQGWKDTVFVNKGERVQLAVRFASYQGRYVFHCHNLEHEDMGMMANFQVT